MLYYISYGILHIVLLLYKNILGLYLTPKLEETCILYNENMYLQYTAMFFFYVELVTFYIIQYKNSLS